MSRKHHSIWVVSTLILTGFLALAVAQTPDGETPASDGVCDELQGGTPGLYGLCVAYSEAHDCVPDPALENPFENCRPASRKILDKYNEKKTATDPEMPGVVAGCPCFDQADLDAIPPQVVSGEYAQCDAIPPITNIISSIAEGNYAQVDETSLQCLYARASDGIFRLLPLTADEAVTCRDLLVDTIASSPYCP